MNNRILKFWEPNAPSFEERFKSLKHAYKKGFQASVSCEPYLDNKVEETYRKLRPFISESFWIGQCSSMTHYVSINTKRNPVAYIRAEKLMRTLYTDEFVKYLYSRLGREPLVRWKGGCKKILGLRRSTRPGLNR